jgi:acyl carrier protein
MQPTLDITSPEAVQSWLANWLAMELSLAPQTVDSREEFLSYGMNSVQAMMLVGDLESRIGIRLPPTLVWDYPTIQSLAAYLHEKTAVLAPLGIPGTNGTAKAMPRRADPAALLAGLEQMSETEIDALLEDYLHGTRQ